MSGGRFNYENKRLWEYIEFIQNEICKNGKELSDKKKKELCVCDPNYLIDNPGEKFYHKYPDEIIEQFKQAIKIIHYANIYAERIDYYVCGDDGDEQFLLRLKEELETQIGWECFEDCDWPYYDISFVLDIIEEIELIILNHSQEYESGEYNDAIVEKFKEGIRYLKLSADYLLIIKKLIKCDIDEDSFIANFKNIG